jgi:O-antigen/teichoic acid export membrane protein
MKRVSKIIKVGLASYIGRIGSFLCVILTIPLIKHTLPIELFSVWMAISSLIAFFSFADLGIGNGLINRLAQANAHDDSALVARTIVSAYFATLFIAVFLIFLFVIINCFLPDPSRLLGSISNENKKEVLSAINIFMVLMVINIPASLIYKIFLGMQKGYLVGLSQFLSSIAIISSVFFVASTSPTLHKLILAFLGTQVLVNLIITIVWIFSRYSKFSARNLIFNFDYKILKELFRIGFMFFVLQLGVAFAFQSDVIVITQSLTQEQYAEYAVVQKLFQFISIAFGAAIVGLWPAFADAKAKADIYWAQRVLVLSLISTGILVGIISCFVALNIKWILFEWTGSLLLPSSFLVGLLACWTVIEALGNVSGSFMNASDILKPQVVIVILLGVTAFIGKWFLVPILGTAGAPLVTLLSYLIISVPFQLYIIDKYFRNQKHHVKY